MVEHDLCVFRHGLINVELPPPSVSARESRSDCSELLPSKVDNKRGCIYTRRRGTGKLNNCDNSNSNDVINTVLFSYKEKKKSLALKDR